MYQCWELAANPGSAVQDSAYSEKGALGLFESNGVFDQSENVYQPGEKLSKKSALVWASRMDRWAAQEE